MGNQTVGYIIEYELSALFFLIVISVRYFSIRRFPNQKSRLFSTILWCTMLDLALDIASSLIIDNVFAVPVPVVYCVCSMFYLFQIILPLLMVGYALTLTGHQDKQSILRQLPLAIPALLVLIFLVTNPATGWLFYLDPVRGYVHGSYFKYTYIACFFYMCATFVIACLNRSRIHKNEFSAICKVLIIVLVTIAIQIIFPQLLLTGVAVAMSVILMYFTLQNPDSMLDTATGTFTYEAMLEFLRDRMEEKERIRFIAVEVHNMHRINDLLGVENGSLLLAQISRFLLSGSGTPWVFRMRGTCFVTVLRNNKDYRSMCDMLDGRMRSPWVVGKTELMVQATVCCFDAAELLDDPTSPEDAVDFLETAFAQAERSGNRGKTVIVGKDFLRSINRAREVEGALRLSLATGRGFELYFQPIWSVKKERFEGAEVLLRFRDDRLGCISPAEFVPIAESNGLVSAMDEMVVRKTCEFIREYNPREKLGLASLEVNLSALEFMNRRLPEMFGKILNEYGVDANYLILEITETAATESYELLCDSMTSLCRSGCRFALDDFGTGYANISQVIGLPFSIVKLDRSMLMGPESVLCDMTRMITHMDLMTVAEGVETARQAELVRLFGVDYIQGYYYARPMCADDLIRFLADNASEMPA